MRSSNNAANRLVILMAGILYMAFSNDIDRLLFCFVGSPIMQTAPLLCLPDFPQCQNKMLATAVVESVQVLRCHPFGRTGTVAFEGRDDGVELGRCESSALTGRRSSASRRGPSRTPSSQQQRYALIDKASCNNAKPRVGVEMTSWAPGVDGVGLQLQDLAHSSGVRWDPTTNQLGGAAPR